MVGLAKHVDIVRLAVSRLEWDAFTWWFNWPIVVAIISLEHWFGLISSCNKLMHLWMLTIVRYFYLIDLTLSFSMVFILPQSDIY